MPPQLHAEFGGDVTEGFVIRPTVAAANPSGDLPPGIRSNWLLLETAAVRRPRYDVDTYMPRQMSPLLLEALSGQPVG